MLPAALPIFPLPNAVLFPHVFLPLHIFEPRYREMVADALAGDRMIGMTLLRPGWEHDYEGRPAVYAVGCAGLITHAEQLPDGRYNIVLRGLEKFRVRDERTGRAYRIADIDTLPEPPCATLAGVTEARRKLEALVLAQHADGPALSPPTMPDEDFINALAQYLEFEPVEKQALLERPDALARCQSVIELLEMRVIAGKRGWTGGH